MIEQYIPLFPDWELMIFQKVFSLLLFNLFRIRLCTVLFRHALTCLTSLILLSLVVVQKWVTLPLYPKMKYKSSPSQGEKNWILKLILVQQNSYRQRSIRHAICIWIVFSPSVHNKEVWNTLTLKFEPLFSPTCTPPESTQVFDLLWLRCSIIPRGACDNQSFPWDGVCFGSCYRNQFSG